MTATPSISPGALAVLGGRPWLERLVAEPLRQPGPAGLLWWQWLALPSAALVALAAGILLGSLTRRILAPILARTPSRWDEVLLARLGRPLQAFWVLVSAYAVAGWLDLPERPDAVIGRGLHAGVLLVLFWGLLRGVDVALEAAAASPWASQPGRASLLPSLRRLAKIAVLVLAAIAVLNELGYPVTSLIAGVGIGGLALALAAQKAVEDLVGALTIGVDQPFRVGDTVRVDGHLGTVEVVGLRSTRIRTLDRTLVAIPNGKLAGMNIETLEARDRLRLACTLPLVYSTTAAQMRAVLEGVEAALRAHPRIWLNDIRVRFAALGTSSLDVEVMAWFQTADWAEFLDIRQELLLRFMEVVGCAGTWFAYPTQTVQLAGGPEKRARS
jgi:MscS family membrane protein